MIIFSFSKKECEALALQMVSLDLNDEEEAKMVSAIFSNAIDCLSEEDRRLPQVSGFTAAHIWRLSERLLCARSPGSVLQWLKQQTGDISTWLVARRDVPASRNDSVASSCRSTQSCRCCGAALASTTRGCCPS